MSTTITLTEAPVVPTKTPDKPKGIRAPSATKVESGGVTKPKRSSRRIIVGKTLLKTRTQLIFRYATPSKDGETKARMTDSQKKNMKNKQLEFYQNLTTPPAPSQTAISTFFKKVIQTNRYTSLIQSEKIFLSKTSIIKAMLGLDEFIGGILRNARDIIKAQSLTKTMLEIKHLRAAFTIYVRSSKGRGVFNGKNHDEIEEMFKTLGTKGLKPEEMKNLLKKYKKWDDSKKRDGILYKGQGWKGTLSRYGIITCSKACKYAVEVIADRYLREIVKQCCINLSGDKRKRSTIQDSHVLGAFEHVGGTILVG